MEKKNLRIIEAPAPGFPLHDLRTIDGGVLVQTTDRVTMDRDTWTGATKRQPTESEWIDLSLLGKSQPASVPIA